MVAACGGAVPMISGRGLGHTGGTLDKLEAIPGYDTAPEPARLRAAVARAGCAIVGQTARLAPADRRLYAIRDATGTVESIPLIVASILSKKLAAGLDGLVMDVKVGSGAFLPGLAEARELAGAIVEVAAGAGLRATALLTDMDRVLGRTAGNAVEVREAIDHLTGEANDERLVEVTVALSRELLALGGLPDADPAQALRSGAAAERFAAMVAQLGGPADLLDAPGRHLPGAPVVTEAVPAEAGHVQGVDVRAVGLAIIDLGGGRRREDDRDRPRRRAHGGRRARRARRPRRAPAGRRARARRGRRRPCGRGAARRLHDRRGAAADRARRARAPGGGRPLGCRRCSRRPSSTSTWRARRRPT